MILYYIYIGLITKYKYTLYIKVHGSWMYEKYLQMEFLHDYSA